MKNDLPTFDLDALTSPVARVTLFKKEHDVMPGGARVVELMHHYLQHKDDPTADKMLGLETMREVVKEVVPSLEDAQVKRMNVKQMTAIVSLALEKMDDVKRMIEEEEKNAAAPPKNKTPSAAKASGHKSSTK